jgi:hypothetical protein
MFFVISFNYDFLTYRTELALKLHCGYVNAGKDTRKTDCCVKDWTELERLCVDEAEQLQVYPLCLSAPDHQTAMPQLCNHAVHLKPTEPSKKCIFMLLKIMFKPGMCCQ